MGKEQITSNKVVGCLRHRGRGQVTGMAAANSVVAVVTSRGWLLRYDFSQGSSPGESDLSTRTKHLRQVNVPEPLDPFIV